jgi:outer membrane protein assembly factor BamB
LAARGIDVIVRLAFSIYALTMGILIFGAARAIAPHDHSIPEFNKTEIPRALPNFTVANVVPKGHFETFREGPERHGAAGEVWPAQGQLKLRFEKPDLNLGLHSASKAAVLGHEDMAFVGGDTSWFHALKLDGTPAWSYRVKDSEWGIHATAAADESQVYLGAYNGRLYALDRATGRANWVRLLGDALGASPLVTEEHLYAAIETVGVTNGYVAKLKKDSGELIWASPFLGEHPHSSPAVSSEHRMVAVGANNSRLFGISDQDGRVVWKVQFPGPIKTSPAIVGRTVIATSWRGGIKAVDLLTGDILWEGDLVRDSMAHPAIIAEMGLAVAGEDSSEWSAYDIKTGKLKWRKRWFDDGVDWSQGSATAQKFKTARGHEWRLWVPCSKTRICLVRASTGELLQQWTIPAKLTGVPVVHRNALWLALDGPLQVWEWRAE